MRLIRLTLVPAIISLLICSVAGCCCEKRDKVETKSVSACPARPDHPLTRQNDRQAENADMADMALTDIHFLPNRPILNGTGTDKLNRLAWIVENYGGTIVLNLREPRSVLTDERMDTVVAYLKQWGLPEAKVQVTVGLPPNQGMSAEEAAVAYDKNRIKSCDAGSANGTILGGK
ncbi:MAG: hypothetical protein GXY33_04725 [Phycisphaerae bacterium]|nr:hypothetical protein [Phycisphaerae bacterium]